MYRGTTRTRFVSEFPVTGYWLTHFLERMWQVMQAACLVYACYIMYVHMKNEFSQLTYNCQFSEKITYTIQIFGNEIPDSY